MKNAMARQSNRAQATPVSNQDLWTKFLYEVATKISGADSNTGVQTLFPFKMWDWGDKEYPIDSIPYSQQIFLNRVPLEPVANYLNSPAAFSDNYQQFIDQINLQDGNDPKLEDLYQALQDEARNLQSVMDDAQVAYRNDKSKPEDESFADWLDNNPVYKGNIAQAQLDYEAAQTDYNDYRTAKFNDIKRAVSKYDDNQLFIKNQAGQPVEVAPWFIDNTPYDYVKKITNNNFGGNATKGNAFSFSLDSSTSEYDYSHVWGSANTSFSYGFFSINASGNYDKIDTSSFEENWSIEFSFQSFDQVTIGIPDWYDSGVVQGRRNGPFRTGFTGYKGTGSPNDVWFFGQEGLLGRMLTTIWVGYRPTVIIKAGKTVQTFVKEKIEAGGSLKIGPFQFGGSGGSETTAQFDYSSNGQITVEGQGDWPYIVGMASQPTVPSIALNERMVAISSSKIETLTNDAPKIYSQTKFRTTPLPHTSTGVPAKQHLNFPAAAIRRDIHLMRTYPFGSADFVVYDTNEPSTVFGAGSCPMLTARPPYITVSIPAGHNFTVQNLSEHPIDVSNY